MGARVLLELPRVGGSTNPGDSARDPAASRGTRRARAHARQGGGSLASGWLSHGCSIPLVCDESRASGRAVVLVA
jgi:hypothetical protein